MTVTVDPHPLPRFRVDGPLSNMPEFQAAFSCQAGDAMVRPADAALQDLVAEISTAIAGCKRLKKARRQLQRLDRRTGSSAVRNAINNGQREVLHGGRAHAVCRRELDRITHGRDGAAACLPRAFRSVLPVSASNVTPLGSVPVWVSVGAGFPVAITVNVPCDAHAEEPHCLR